MHGVPDESGYGGRCPTWRDIPQFGSPIPEEREGGAESRSSIGPSLMPGKWAVVHAAVWTALAAVLLAPSVASATDAAQAHQTVKMLRAELATIQGTQRSLDFEHSQLSKRIEERRRDHGGLFDQVEERRRGREQVTERLKALKEGDQAALDADLARLKSEEDHLMANFVALTDHMKALRSEKSSIQAKLGDSGVEHLVETYTQTFNPILKGVVIKSWEDIGVPFFSLIAKAADTNSRLVDHVSVQIDSHVHYNVKKSPFVSGLLFYCVLLIPVLLLSIVAIQMIKTTATISASHFVLFSSLYLFLLSVGCGVLSIFGRSEPLLLFQVRHGMAFVACMLLLSFLYIFNVIVLAAQASLSKSRQDSAQFIATLAIGGHFFWFVWRPTMLDETIKMFTFVYCIYATMLGCVIYERAERLRLPWRDSRFTIRAVQIAHAVRIKSIEAFNVVMRRVGGRRLRRPSGSKGHLTRTSAKDSSYVKSKRHGYSS